MSPAHVAIIGGGYSGTLQAVNLLRLSKASITLIERCERPARGAAYGTPHASHLLNVRAARMSAFADEPDHFARWISARGGDPDGFAQRRVYGTYLEEILGRAKAEAGDRLHIVREEAQDIRRAGGKEIVWLRAGGELAADAVILALGNLAPSTPASIAADALPPGTYIHDPWRADITAGLTQDDVVLLIGTGLTAVDAALMLEDAGFEGRILALSRRGLVPRAHGAAVPPAAPPDPPPLPDCLGLLRSVRRESVELGWRMAVDRLRSVTQRLWASASAEERSRFLRHLRPWWDVHRHRLAPAISGRIEAMERGGRLEFAAGRIVSVEAEGTTARLSWRPRGEDAAREVRVRRIINCTGPSGDLKASGEPLLANLARSGRIRPDALRIGIDVDPGCRAIGGSGEASETLFAVGPLTRGAFWEMVAVPDLRHQVHDLAQAIRAGFVHGGIMERGL